MSYNETTLPDISDTEEISDNEKNSDTEEISDTEKIISDTFTSTTTNTTNTTGEQCPANAVSYNETTSCMCNIGNSTTSTSHSKQ